ncbi:hypothetical protein PGT21_026657 [Puccinia graminis f. sp. tritici]|uniref:Uncharacterized protein n=1 Tax=Puccinia graminis f. sp. tritici TaxID=56615 RepID=A0A5B0QC77_PUCGR|nr:hypothetical protein PGT21_026657 [Puccinia graminis f. sp. tritici]
MHIYFLINLPPPPVLLSLLARLCITTPIIQPTNLLHGQASERKYPVGHNLSGQISSQDHLLQSARKEKHSTTEDFFLSKAFSDSLGPSRIIPFFYKALGPDQSGEINPKDIRLRDLAWWLPKRALTSFGQQRSCPIELDDLIGLWNLRTNKNTY